MTLKLAATVEVDASRATGPLQQSAKSAADLRQEMEKAASVQKAAAESYRQSKAELDRLRQAVLAGTISQKEYSASADRLRQQATLSAAANQEARRRLDELSSAQKAAEAETRRATAAMAQQERQANRTAGALDRKGQTVGRLGLQMNRLVIDLASGRLGMDDFTAASGKGSAGVTRLTGAVASAAGMFGGPWGLAIGAATAGLIGLIVEMVSAGDASRRMEAALEGSRQAKERLRAATEELDRLTGRYKQTLQEQIAEQIAAQVADLNREVSIRRVSRALLEQALASRKALEASISIGGAEDRRALGAASGVQGLRAAALEKEIAELDATIAERQGLIVRGVRETFRILREESEKAAGSTKRVTAAVQDGTRADERAAEARRRFIEQTQRLIDNAIEQQMREDAAAVRSLEQRFDAAAAAARRYQETLEQIAGLEGRGVIGAAQAETFRGGAAEELAESFARQLRTELPTVFGDAGKSAGRGAGESLLAQANSIGRLIGGAAGGAIQAVTGVLEGLSTGDFRGVPGRAGAILSLGSAALRGNEDIKALGKDITGKLDEIFGGASGDGTFMRRFSTVIVNAGIGAAAGGGSTTAAIGGAIGGELGKVAGEAIGKSVGGALGSALGPLGSILGSVLGGVLGSLLNKEPTGRATLNIQGGVASILEGRGNSASATRAAVGNLNTVSDALSTIADRLGGELGDARVSIIVRGDTFRVDPTGAGRRKGAGVIKTNSAEEAVQLALADAIRDGGVTGVSPRVQTALRRYAENVNKAVSEALKVQSLEDLLSTRENPFSVVFRDFERQAKERLKVARDYGFDLVEIERINGEERAKLLAQQLSDATRSVRDLLDDLTFGQRAEGSATQRLAGLAAEKARLEELIAGGDLDAIDKLARVVEQQLDLSRQAFGTTAQFASDRADAIASLDALLRQTEARINEAAARARDGTVEQLTELNRTADEQTLIQQQILAAVAALGTTSSSGAFDAAPYQRFVS
jgi:hypothetical protein